MAGAHESGVDAPVKPANRLLASLPTTIFEVMTQLAQQHKSINLGQGFPDEEGPDSMKKALGAAVLEHSNQYPPMLGVPELRQAVARHSERYQGLPLDWQSQVLITVGAAEALSAVFAGLLDEGDEVVLFDPQYDLYAPMAQRCGARLRIVQLQPPGWAIPEAELAAAFTARTKLVVLNTPHNPTGKVFSAEELELVAGHCRRTGAVAVLDEVYEHLVFPNEAARHVSMRTLPGMAHRCLRVGSAGKTFSFTGWKVGWVTGPPELVKAAAAAHQFLVFTVPSAQQRAVAFGLDHEQAFYEGLGGDLEAKRAYMARRLADIGFDILPSQGTYFLVADIRPLLRSAEETDVDFAQRLTVDAGVTVIPVSAFYASAAPPRHLVRFCFCKTDDKLATACDRLERYFARNGGSHAEA